MKIYLDNNLGVEKVEQEELTQDTYGYNILKVYIPNAVLTPYDTFTCYYGALLQNGRKVGWFAMEARTSTDADYEENYTLYKATLEQCVVSVEGKVYIGCQVLLGNSGNATLIKKNTAVVQFNVRKSVAINNDILVLDPDQTNTDVLESYKNLLENALLTYVTKASIADNLTTNDSSKVLSAKQGKVLKDTIDALEAAKADKSDTYTKTEVDALLVPKVSHDGNQLTDSEGNNIYPALEPDTVISNQDWTLTSDSGWTNLAGTKRFVINYGNEIPVGTTFSLSLQCYYSNNVEYNLLVEIWTNNNGVLTRVDYFTYTCPTHSTMGFYENKIIENYENEYSYPLLVTLLNPNGNTIKYAQSISGNSIVMFSNLSSTTLNLTSATTLNNFNFRYSIGYPTETIKDIKEKLNSYATVKKDGTGDYTTITEALNNVPEGTPIIVYEGVYEENIKMINTTVNIRGVDKNKCIIKSKNGGYDYPTLYVKSGILKDLTIIAEYVQGTSTEIGTSNGAYAIHIESEASANTTMEIDNCILKSDFSASAGIGLRTGATFILRNSVLINNQVSGRGSYESNGGLGALYCHDSMGVEGNSKVELYNNLFISNLGSSICFYHVPNKDGNSVNMICTNNVLKDKINGYNNNIWNRNNAFDYFTIDIGYGNSNNALNKYAYAVTLNNIFDSYGNHRFIEGNGTPATITGFTENQCKWSLSGTHLMLVLAGSVANGTTLPASTIIATFDLPLFIYNKVQAVWGGKYIESKTIQMIADGWGSQGLSVHFGKNPNVSGRLFFEQSGAVTLTADRHFRIQFDLLIDSE